MPVREFRQSYKSPEGTLSIRELKGEKQLFEEVLEIRRRFAKQHSLGPSYFQVDSYDKLATHIMVEKDNNPKGILRVNPIFS